MNKKESSNIGKTFNYGYQEKSSKESFEEESCKERQEEITCHFSKSKGHR